MGRGKVVSTGFDPFIKKGKSKSNSITPTYWVSYCSTNLDPSDLMGIGGYYYPCYDSPLSTPPTADPLGCDGSVANATQVTFKFKKNLNDRTLPVCVYQLASVAGAKVKPKKK